MTSRPTNPTSRPTPPPVAPVTPPPMVAPIPVPAKPAPSSPRPSRTLPPSAKETLSSGDGYYYTKTGKTQGSIGGSSGSFSGEEFTVGKAMSSPVVEDVSNDTGSGRGLGSKSSKSSGYYRGSKAGNGSRGLKSKASPTDFPTLSPTLGSKALSPTFSPTLSPTFFPTLSPTLIPTLSPTIMPVSVDGLLSSLFLIAGVGHLTANIFAIRSSLEVLWLLLLRLKGWWVLLRLEGWEFSQSQVQSLQRCRTFRSYSRAHSRTHFWIHSQT